jgi:hypothetical protein
MKAQTETGFTGNRVDIALSNQVLAANGQQHDGHRNAKVKRLTLRSRCSAPGDKSLILAARN